MCHFPQLSYPLKPAKLSVYLVFFALLFIISFWSAIFFPFYLEHQPCCILQLWFINPHELSLQRALKPHQPLKWSPSPQFVLEEIGREAE